MASYTATVSWARGADEPFTDSKFSRGHQWSFDGGVSFRASSSPHVVPRFSDPAGVDPEEALVASLSSCHMLTFLYFAAKKGFVIDTYEDTAEGVMAKNDKGRYFVKTVTLRPKIAWGGDKRPTTEELDALHHTAHDECFIANSVITDVKVVPA
ncbi:MAG: peroxiredoxin [Rhizobiales bacterium]|nr:peroxiredoxin [Hyphomicrobiales bacterium]